MRVNLSRCLIPPAALAAVLITTGACKSRPSASETTASTGGGSDSTYDEMITALAEAVTGGHRDEGVTVAAARLGDGAAGIALSDDGADAMRAELRALTETMERRNKEAALKVKEAEERLRITRTGGVACVASSSDAFCRCDAKSADGTKTSTVFSAMPAATDTDMGYLSEAERFEGFALAMGHILEAKVQSGTCEAAKLQLERRGLGVMPVPTSDTLGRDCSCRTVGNTDREAQQAMATREGEVQATDKALISNVAPTVQLVCEQRYRVVDTVQTRVEHPEAFTRYFFSSAVTFVTGTVKPWQSLDFLKQTGCQELNAPTYNRTSRATEPRWMQACHDFARRSQPFSENPDVRCDGARPLDLMAVTPKDREDCSCYLADRMLSAKIREFQLKRLSDLQPQLEVLTKLSDDRHAMEARLKELKESLDKAKEANRQVVTASAAARLAPTATLEIDSAGEEIAALKDRLNALSAVVQRQKGFSNSALSAHIAGLTTLNAFTALSPGKSYESMPRFAATWIYVDYDPARSREPGLEFRTPIRLNWRHPNCSFTFHGSQDCQFAGVALPLSSLPTPTQVAEAGGFKGFVRFIPATNLFYVYENAYGTQAANFYEPTGEIDQNLRAIWKRDTEGVKASDLETGSAGPAGTLAGDELLAAEAKIRPLQSTIVMRGAIQTQAAQDRLLACQCDGLSVEPTAPTNLPGEACLQFPRGHAYRSIHRGWICDIATQSFTCKGKAPVPFQCRAARPDDSGKKARRCEPEDGFYCGCTAHCASKGKNVTVWLDGKSSRKECEQDKFGPRLNGFVKEGWSRGCPDGKYTGELTCKAYKWWDDPSAPSGFKTPFKWGRTFEDQCQ